VVGKPNRWELLEAWIVRTGMMSDETSELTLPKRSSPGHSVRRRWPRRRRGKRVGKSLNQAAPYLGLVVFCFCATTYLVRLQDVAMVGAAGAILLLVLTGQRTFRVGGPPGVLMLLWGAFVGLSVPTSIWLGPSIQGTIDVARLLIIFVVTVNAITTRQHIHWLLVLLCITMVVFPGFGGLKDYYAGVTREVGRADWMGVFGNANLLALAMLMTMPFAVAFVAISRKKAAKLLWVAVIVSMCVVAVFTKSRAGFIALAGLGVAGIALSRRRALAAGAVLAAGIAILAAAPDDFKERVAGIIVMDEERDWSARSRLIYWGIAADIALTRPLTGTGVGTYERANAEHGSPELTSGGQLWKDTHSTWLNIWAEIGTPGLLAYLGAAISLLVLAFRTLRQIPPGDPFHLLLRAGIASIFVFIVTGTFNTFHNVWFYYVIFGIMLAIMRIAETEYGEGGLKRATHAPGPSRSRRIHRRSRAVGTSPYS